MTEMMTPSVHIPEDLANLLIPLATVRQHPDNPNSGDVELIAESILTYGFTSPIIVQASTGFIVAGNHRYAAMLALEQTMIPAVYVNLTDDEALAYLVMDNRASEVAVRDEFLLATILDKVASRPQGLAGTGYDMSQFLQVQRTIDYNQNTPLDAVRGMRPTVTITGYLNDDGSVEPFTMGDIPDVVVRLADLGYRAKGVDQ